MQFNMVSESIIRLMGSHYLPHDKDPENTGLREGVEYNLTLSVDKILAMFVSNRQSSLIKLVL